MWCQCLLDHGYLANWHFKRFLGSLTSGIKAIVRLGGGAEVDPSVDQC